MLRPDANDQSKVPNQFLPRTPWPSTGEERSNQPTTEGNWYQPELPSSPSLGGETHVAYQQYPPMWNTGGRLAIAPTVKASARELRTASILALTVVMAILLALASSLVGILPEILVVHLLMLCIRCNLIQICSRQFLVITSRQYVRSPLPKLGQQLYK